MLIERSHIVAPAEKGQPQRCARCRTVVVQAHEKPYVEGTRVGVIIGAASQVSSHYAITEERDTTPELCRG